MAHPADWLELRLEVVPPPVEPTAPRVHSLRVPRCASVRHLKRQLHHHWHSSPPESALTLTKGQRVLHDTQLLADVFQTELTTSPPGPLVLSVIVRPSAWSPSATALSPTPARADAGDSYPDAPLATPSPTQLSATLTTSTMESAPKPEVDPSASPSSSPSTASVPPAVAATAAGGRYAPYLAHLHRLVPLQRALLLLHLQKAHAYYAALVAAQPALGPSAPEPEGLEPVEDLLRQIGLGDDVEQQVAQAEKEWDERCARATGAAAEEAEFRVVHLGGLPYLLHTPAGALLHAKSTPLHRPSSSHLRARVVLAHLTTLLQLLVTLSPTAPALAHGRAVPARPSPAAVAAAHQVLVRAGLRGTTASPGPAAAGGLGLPAFPGADPLEQPQQQQQQAPAPHLPLPLPLAARRRATLSVVIHLEAVFSLLVPLFLLSVKLAFLLWLFGRNASPAKRLALAAMAVLWVGFEGWGILRRRQAQGRERDRIERDRRRAVRAQVRAQQQQQQEAQAQAGAGRAGAGAGAEVAAAAPRHHAAEAGPLAPAPAGNLPNRPGPAVAAAAPARPAGAAATPARRVRTPAPRWSPKYWLNTLAAVGLVAEARELGLQPRYLAGRPVAPARHPADVTGAAGGGIGRLRRALRTAGVAFVLFLATLVSPEVERKRRRALEKRERLLAERRAREGRDRIARAQVHLRAGEEPQMAREDEDVRARARAQSAPATATATLEERPLPFGAAPPQDEADEEEEGEQQHDGQPELDTATLRQRRMAALAPPSARLRAGEGGNSSSQNTAFTATANANANATTSAVDPSGRARVSDAELFRDGGSDAYTFRAGVAAPDLPGPGGSLGPLAAADAPPPPSQREELDPEEEEEDVASVSGDGASTSSGDDAELAGIADGEPGNLAPGGGGGEGDAPRIIRAAGREGDELDEVVALF